MTATQAPDIDLTAEPATGTVARTQTEDEIHVTRRRIDAVLIGLGAVITVVLLAAGGLLLWGSGFATGYVNDELSAQNITFASADA